MEDASGARGGTETHRTRRSDARRREALEDARGARTPTGPASEIAKDMARGVSRCEGECQAEIEEDNSQPSPFQSSRARRVSDAGFDWFAGCRSRRREVRGEV